VKKGKGKNYYLEKSNTTKERRWEKGKKKKENFHFLQKGKKKGGGDPTYPRKRKRVCNAVLPGEWT